MKGIAVAFGLLGFHLATAAVAAPPEVYDVEISYRINAFRNQRLMQYYEMIRFLKKAGFQRDPEEVVAETEPEDVNSTRTTRHHPRPKSCAIC